MPKATDEQVQRFVNERLRPWAERVRALYLEAKDHKAAIDDVYVAMTENPTWSDNRTDGPPHLMAVSDVLAMNTALTAFIAVVEGGDPGVMDDFAAQYPVVLDACVRPPSV